MEHACSHIRVTLLNEYDSGGGGTATMRIHRALRGIGVDSTMLVDHQEDNEPGVEAPEGALWTVWAMDRPFIDRAPLGLYGGSDGVFSPGWLPESLSKRVDALDPDVLHLNWMGGGFLDVGNIADFDRPIVWTLHDMWPFTGGCHYTADCDGFESSCGSCPSLNSSRTFDLSKATWWWKRRTFRNADITVVSPSQ